MPTPTPTFEQKNPEEFVPPSPSFVPEQPADAQWSEQQYTPETVTPTEIPGNEEDFLNEEISQLEQTVKTPAKKKPTTVSVVRDDLTVKIEHIMEDGLVDAFREMTPVQKQEFKIVGEKTALQIRDIIKGGKIKIKKIFQLLVNWLKIIPGVNRFFIEQEAKIKADKISALTSYRDQQ